MASKKISKQARRRLTILTPLVFLTVGYLLFTLSTTIIQLYKLHREEQELQENLKTLKGDSEELKTEITKLQDKDYVARYARENYLYTKDGEYVIKVDTDDDKKEKNKLSLNDKYVIYGAYALLGLIIIFIIFRRRKKKKLAKSKKKGKK